MSNLKDYGFIITIILLIVLNMVTIYFIRNSNSILIEKITNINNKYDEKINSNMIKDRNEYNGKINSILSQYSSLNHKKKFIKPVIKSKSGDTQVSETKKEQPKGNKELSDALNFNGYANSIMFCYTSPK